MNSERNVRATVVMIVTGADAGLPRRLESVLGQLGSTDEVLIVACDAAAEAAAFVATDGMDVKITAAVKSFRESLEAALRQASGESIFLAESCDTWHPGKFEACLDALEQGAMAAVHDAVVVDGDLNELESSLLGHRFVHGMLSKFFRNRCIGCCLAFRREVLAAALPVPACVSIPDRWLWVAARRMGRVTFMDRALMFYCSHRTTAGKRRVFRAQRKRIGVRELWSVCFILSRRIRMLRRVRHCNPK